MRSLRAHPALTILLVILALGLLTGIAYAVSRLTGFIPGFGFTADASAVYVLKQPAQAEKDGVSVRVESATSDRDMFWVTVIQSGKTATPQFRDTRAASVILADGTKIDFRQGSSDTDERADQLKANFEFAALPAGTQALTFHYDGLVSDGKVIWSLDIPLQLRPIRADEIIPAEATQAVSLRSESYGGLALSLDQVAPASNKTVLQVSLRFDQPGLSLNTDWDVTLSGADGVLYPLTEVTTDTSDGTKKLYETLPFKGGEALTLKLAVFPDIHKLPMSLDFSGDAPSFSFDPGPNAHIGQTWQLDQTVQAGKYVFHITQARLTQDGGATKLVFQAAPAENLAGFMLYNPDDKRVKGSEGGVPDEKGNMDSTVLLSAVPDRPIVFHFMRAYYTTDGDWQIHWQAPAAPGGVIVGATNTPAPAPVLFATPTLTSSDPLLLQVQALAQKFDAPFQQGPGWVHVVTETISENQQVGQAYPPPYLKSEQWLEIDPDGYILRTVWLDRDVKGQIIQQVATIGSYYFNFTTGDSGSNGNSKYRLSLDMLTQSLSEAGHSRAQITGENVPCDSGQNGSGSDCLLVTLSDSFAQSVQNLGEAQISVGSGQRTWINLQSGQQIKSQSFWILPDGSEKIIRTARPVLVEKVDMPPREILDILAKVVVP